MIAAAAWYTLLPGVLMNFYRARILPAKPQGSGQRHNDSWKTERAVRVDAFRIGTSDLGMSVLDSGFSALLAASVTKKKRHKCDQ